MKKAREVTPEYILFCRFETHARIVKSGVDSEKLDRDGAAYAIEALKQAGFVILPREPDEGMIRAGLQAIMAEIFDAPEDSDTLAVIRNRATAACYRAMLSNYESRQEGEK